MKDLFIVANWKANKTTLQAKEWLEEISNNYQYPIYKKIIVLPSFTALHTVLTFMSERQLPFDLGVQDVSLFEEGPHTGEVSAIQIKELAVYALVGHSERRSEFKENDEVLSGKTEQTKQAGIEPIFCVRGLEDAVPTGVKIVAYEPVSAIGTGNPDTPENADKVALEIKNKYPEVKYVLYGGSVTSENVRSFTEQEYVDGVLVGKASLDAKEFSQIIINA